MTCTLRWLFLSNMFPSSTDPSYGAFVARSLDDLRAESMDIRHVVVIRGRQKRWEKLRAYGRYFLELLTTGIFGDLCALCIAPQPSHRPAERGVLQAPGASHPWR
jgi:hypothetical protein